MINEQTSVILTIDDSNIFRRFIHDHLTSLGYSVIEAKDGKEGLTVFERDNPDLVLIDMHMPELDGMEVLRVLTENSPDTPTIIVSGDSDFANAIEALRRGAWDYMLKTSKNLDMLDHAISQALERARLTRQNRVYQLHLDRHCQL